MKKLVKHLITDQDQIQVKMWFDSDSGQTTMTIIDMETNAMHGRKVYPESERVNAHIDYSRHKRSFK